MLAEIALVEMVQIAIQTRPTEPFAVDPFAPRQVEIQASETVVGLIPDHTADTLQASINAFLTDLVGSKPTDLAVIKPDEVFISRSQKVVVKVFSEKKLYKSLREISGQHALEELDLKKVALEKILGAGKCILDGKTYVLLALSQVPGQEIKGAVDAIFTMQDQTKAIARAQHILQRLGETFAQMHTRKAVTFKTAPQYAAYARQGTLLKIEKYLQDYQKNGGQEHAALQQLFQEKIAQNQSTTLTVAAGHGDTHLMNFLFDETTDEIGIVDTTRAHLWVDPEGAPLYPIHIQDVARTIDDIAKWVLHHTFDPALIETLTDSFKAGYISIAPNLIPPSEQDLGISVAFLSRLRTAPLWDQKNDPVEKSAGKRIYAYYLSKLLHIPPRELF